MAMVAPPAHKRLYSPPPLDSDYYKILDVLDAKERTIAQRVREFAEAEVAPIIEDYWLRDEFPHEIIPKLSALNIAGIGYLGYGAAGGSWVLNGLVAMELSRVELIHGASVSRQARSICAETKSKRSDGCRR